MIITEFIPAGCSCIWSSIARVIHLTSWHNGNNDYKYNCRGGNSAQLASLLLVVLGGCYIVLHLLGKGGHTHSHNQPMEKMAVAGLILVPALSPCATTLPVFLAVGNSTSMMVLAIIVLLFRY